uniref:HIT-type domain-containing protein n=1 Tax=Timema poppense TaxID=170557 RepID=A0A7R9HH24_TIMPO|nr:unnamed protein product [Timema poppensis]
MAAFGGRLGTCEVCACKDAKYTCPKCEVKTCCIACANIHKKELSCSGVRDKINFKQLSKFTNMDLQSDYMLLEEMTRNVEKYSRDPLKGHSRHEKDIPHHLFKLKAATSSRDIRWHFLPRNFSRHKDNTTYLDWKTNVIWWRVEWIFPQGNNIKCVDER